MAIMPYPAHLSREARLRDGRSYLLRPIQAEDADRLQRFTRGLSQQSRYFRFISTLNELTPRMLVRYTQIDYDRELALVVTTAGIPGQTPISGIARLLIDPDGERAEFAILLHPEISGQGLGRLVLERIIAQARAQGLAELYGEVARDNRAMLRLAEKLGFAAQPLPESPDLVRVCLALTDSATNAHS